MGLLGAYYQRARKDATTPLYRIPCVSLKDVKGLNTLAVCDQGDLSFKVEG